MIRRCQAPPPMNSLSFLLNDTATTEIYTLSLHDALPIWKARSPNARTKSRPHAVVSAPAPQGASVSSRLETLAPCGAGRSEEHTSELQSQSNLVCRLLLEKKKKKIHMRWPPFVCCTRQLQ